MVGTEVGWFGGLGAEVRREHDASVSVCGCNISNPTHHADPPTRHLVWAASVPATMRSISLLASCLAALASLARAELNLSEPLQSKQVLPSTFKPPQVFKNAHLVRNINLDKAYARETINVIIENIDSKPQSEYYLPFEASLIANIGSLEVRDKKAAEKGTFKVQVVGFDTER